MLSEFDAVLSSFTELLSTLRENDKNKINALTFFARDNVHLEGFPRGVVEATVSHVRTVPPSYKLLALYVVDSIVKNVEVPYRKLFTKDIVSIFVHSFQMIRDEGTRERLFSLRKTWKDIFPFRKMHELDVLVKRLDPAWPLLPDDMRESVPLPSIPKIDKNKISDQPLAVASSQLSAPVVTEAVIAESRDPRRNRKRKSSPQSGRAEGEFLIDRDGNGKMESIARKKGKEEIFKLPIKRNRPSMGDLDMREVPTPITIPPHAISNQGYSKPTHDVDMRFSNRLSGPTAPSISVNARLPVNPMDIVLSTPSELVPSSRVASGENVNRAIVKQPQPPPIQQPLPPMPHSQYNRQFPQPPPPHRASPEQLPPYSHPPIRGPLWSVEIDGLPEMINIGIDPRMLSRVPTPKTARQITVDGRKYPLLLDRVQPLIQVEDRVHAVRFRCDNLAFLIDHQRFIIPGIGYTRIRAAGRERIAYLGGPGHEIVIDGRPHTVPFNSQYATINIDRVTVPISYACEFPQDINVLPAIPPKILDWARRGLFGSPGSLHLAPLNPLVEMEHHSDNRSGEGRSDQHHHHARISPPNGVPNGAPETATPTVNAQQLFQQLVAAGIFNKPHTLPKLNDYDWETFRQPCTKAIDALYCGFQCAQCGIRFKSETSTEFADHLDYHYVKNSAEHQEHRNRTFYQSSDYWLLSEMTTEGAPQFSTPAGRPEDKPEVKCPSFADESKNVCAVCFEKFDTFFDRDEGEWMLRDAVIQDGKVYHPICMEDAGKQFTPGPESVKEQHSDEVGEGRTDGEMNPQFRLKEEESDASSVPKIEPQIETNNAIIEPVVVNFSSSSLPRVASLPSNLSSSSSTSTFFVMKREDTAGVSPPGTIASVPPSPPLLNTSPSSSPPPPLDSQSRPPLLAEEPLSCINGTSDGSAFPIPGLSLIGDTVCQEGEAVGDSGGGGGGRSSSSFIASDPLAALQAVLRGETSLLTQRPV